MFLLAPAMAEHSKPKKKKKKKKKNALKGIPFDQNSIISQR
jgi:hypothetical protein